MEISIKTNSLKSRLKISRAKKRREKENGHIEFFPLYIFYLMSSSKNWKIGRIERKKLNMAIFSLALFFTRLIFNLFLEDLFLFEIYILSDAC